MFIRLGVMLYQVSKDEYTSGKTWVVPANEPLSESSMQMLQAIHIARLWPVKAAKPSFASLALSNL